MRTLILLASLLNSWEPINTAVSNSVDTQKPKFNDVRDRILAEEVCIIDSGETSTNSAFNVESRGRDQDRSNWSRERSKSKNGQSQSKFRKPTNTGIVERQATLKEIVEHHRKKTTREAELVL